mgnify:CR=1 FL=1
MKVLLQILLKLILILEAVMPVLLKHRDLVPRLPLNALPPLIEVVAVIGRKVLCVQV